MERQGFLAVLTHPHLSSSSQTEDHALLSLDEFHDWYESEHIPLRLNNLKEFLCGARYKLALSCIPKQEARNEPDWLALYLLESPNIFRQSVYTSLRDKRSEREKDVMKRIEVLVRITGEVLEVADGQSQGWTGFQPGRPSPWLLTHELKSSSDEQAIQLLESWKGSLGHQGHLRTHLIKISESGVSRFAVGVKEPQQDADGVPGGYWVIHGV